MCLLVGRTVPDGYSQAESVEGAQGGSPDWKPDRLAHPSEPPISYSPVSSATRVTVSARCGRRKSATALDLVPLDLNVERWERGLDRLPDPEIVGRSSPNQAETHVELVVEGKWQARKHKVFLFVVRHLIRVPARQPNAFNVLRIEMERDVLGAGTSLSGDDLMAPAIELDNLRRRAGVECK